MSSYRLVMRAFPAEYRQEHGAEIVDTANSLTDNRWSVRQSLGLLTLGIQTRSRSAIGSDPRRVWSEGLLIAILLMSSTRAVDLTMWLSGHAARGDIEMIETSSILSWHLAAAVVACVVLSRTTSRHAVALIAALELGPHVASVGSTTLASLLFILAGYSILLFFLNRHGTGARVVSTGVLVVGVSLILMLAVVIQIPFAITGIGLVATTSIGILVSPWDPRPLVASGYWFVVSVGGPSLATAITNTNFAGIAISTGLVTFGILLLVFAHRSLKRITRLGRDLSTT